MSSGWIEHQNGILHVTGENRADLLNRMSTQALLNLQAGHGRATVLTTNIGRIIDRLIFAERGDNSYLFTSDNFSDGIARYLMRYIFFNDDIQIVDITAQKFVLGIYRISAEQQTTLHIPTELPLHHWQTVTVNEIAIDVHKTELGYWLVGDQSDRSAMQATLIEIGIAELDEATYEQWRIEAGVPRYGRELTKDYIPLETGLWNDISFAKGCYLGQEIIARMESRKAVNKQLVQLETADSVAVGDLVLTAEGKKVGSITSTTGTLSLGYMKKSSLDASLLVGEVAVVAVKNLAGRG